MNRKNKPIKWPLLALLFGLALSGALVCLGNEWLLPFAPVGFLQHFLRDWFDARGLLIALSLLPLLGWLLLHFGLRAGKWIINGTLGLLLAADVVVLALHFITSLSLKSTGFLGETVLLALACPIVCIPALVMTNKWYPKI